MPSTVTEGMEEFAYSEGEINQQGLDSDYGASHAYFYDPAFKENMNFTKKAGWGSPGRLVSISLSPNATDINVMEGSPRMPVTSLITEATEEIELTFDHPTVLGLKLCNASTFAQKFNFATGEGNGQTTVKTGSDATNTRFKTSVTSATGISAGDFIYVDPRDNTNGGFIQVVKVERVVGDVVYHTKLDAPLKASMQFKKIAGNKSGTTDENIGIQNIIGSLFYPNIALKLVTKLTNNRAIQIQGYYNCKVKIGKKLDFNDGSNLATFSIKLMPLRELVNVQHDNGNTYKSGIFGKTFTIPEESSFTPA